jgi:hypothetical protein
MRHIKTLRRLAATGLLLAAGSTWAHEPVARCFLLNAETVRCRGATNDGEALPGARMEVMAHDGKTLLEGKLDADSTLTFKKPAQAFYVLFDTGPGLQVTVEQEDIAAPPAGRVPGWMRKPSIQR